jgi:hypothetical protein
MTAVGSTVDELLQPNRNVRFLLLLGKTGRGADFAEATQMTRS